MEINGTSAIVTGGASGLGEATSRKLSASGATVVILDMNAEKGEALAKEVGGLFVSADVTNPEQVQVAVDAAVDAGPLRSLVNCAGIGWAQRTIGRSGEPHDLGAFEKVVQVNLVGSFNLTRLAAEAMAGNDPLDDGERGVIVNTASVAAFDGQVGQAAYSASKAGVAGMTLPIARELARVGIRVMAVAPGIFDTPMLAAMPDQVRASLGAQVPFPSRLGRPEEYAALVRHIIENPMLNGETIRLDGAIRMAPR